MATEQKQKDLGVQEQDQKARTEETRKVASKEVQGETARKEEETKAREERGLKAAPRSTRAVDRDPVVI